MLGGLELGCRLSCGREATGRQRLFDWAAADRASCGCAAQVAAGGGNLGYPCRWEWEGARRSVGFSRRMTRGRSGDAGCVHATTISDGVAIFKIGILATPLQRAVVTTIGRHSLQRAWSAHVFLTTAGIRRNCPPDCLRTNRQQDPSDVSHWRAIRPWYQVNSS